MLLDGSHAGTGAEQAAEPSSAEMIRALKPKPNRSLLLKVTAVASCQKGQRGLDLAGKEHGLFAWCLAEAYGGAADANRDTLVDPAELFAYLKKEMPAAGANAQAPELFLPNDRPPRLSEAAKKSIRKLAGYTDKPTINLEEASQEYDAALKAAGGEPEPRLLFGLVLLKYSRTSAKERDTAAQHFEIVKNELPDRLLPYAALAWLRLEKRSFTLGDARADQDDREDSHAGRPRSVHRANHARAIPVGGATPRIRPRSQRAVASTQRRGGRAGRRGSRPGAAAVALYNKGRRHSEEILADFDKKIELAVTDADKLTLGVNRKLLANYADFPDQPISRPGACARGRIVAVPGPARAGQNIK